MDGRGWTDLRHGYEARAAYARVTDEGHTCAYVVAAHRMDGLVWANPRNSRATPIKVHQIDGRFLGSMLRTVDVQRVRNGRAAEVHLDDGLRFNLRLARCDSPLANHGRQSRHSRALPDANRPRPRRRLDQFDF